MTEERFRYYVPFVYTERQDQPCYGSRFITLASRIETSKDIESVKTSILRELHLLKSQVEIVLLDWKLVQ